MTIQPVVRTQPKYPGSTAKRTLLTAFRSLMTSRVTLTGCLWFLLQCSLVFTSGPVSAQPASPGTLSD
ncbi:MAG TPA: hypothetical protein PKO06_15320, partial [Candidatus Ozemobacteraceae bacterium]|nr:hypothetical protein [Candidatus Ozemobacteraceae bacterium]